MAADNHKTARVAVLEQVHSDLFDAASVVLDWLKELPVEQRPIAKFNRLLDAINCVREAHQMEPDDVRR